MGILTFWMKASGSEGPGYPPTSGHIPEANLEIVSEGQEHWLLQILTVSPFLQIPVSVSLFHLFVAKFLLSESLILEKPSLPSL